MNNQELEQKKKEAFKLCTYLKEDDYYGHFSTGFDAGIKAMKELSKPSEEQEKTWTEEFEIVWGAIEKKFSFPLGDEHKLLVKNAALGIYLQACRVRSSEAESLSDSVKALLETLGETIKENDQLKADIEVVKFERVPVEIHENLKLELERYRGTGVKLLDVLNQNKSLKEENNALKKNIEQTNKDYQLITESFCKNNDRKLQSLETQIIELNKTIKELSSSREVDENKTRENFENLFKGELDFKWSNEHQRFFNRDTQCYWMGFLKSRRNNIT